MPDDPHAAGPDGPERDAEDRVRSHLRDLAADAHSASEVPANVTAEIVSALRSQSPPARSRRWLLIAAVALVALVALVAAVSAAGGLLLYANWPVSTANDATANDATANNATANDAAAGWPPSDREIAELLRQPPELGPLTDPQRREACLSGLGFPPTTTVLGARPVEVDQSRDVLILLPGDVPSRLNALVVAPECNATDAGLRAHRLVAHP